MQDSQQSSNIENSNVQADQSSNIGSPEVVPSQQSEVQNPTPVESLPVEPAPVEQVQNTQTSDPVSSFVGAVQDLGQNLANVAQNVGVSAENTVQNHEVVKVEMDEKVIAALSYLLLLAVIALLVKPESAFVRLHARQGLLLSVLVFVLFGAMAFLSLFGFLGELLALLVMFVIFALFIVIVYSMYLALTGVWWKIPVLSVIADKIPVELFAKITKEAIKDPLVQAKTDFESRTEVQNQIDGNNNSN